MAEKRLTGYCTRCGGDCLDDGERLYHRCPPRRAEAPAVVALKFKLDELVNIMERRPWARTMTAQDFADLRTAIDAARAALQAAYP